MNNRPELHQLILQHNAEKAIEFIQESKTFEDQNMTPLQLAAYEGQIQIVLNLLNQGISEDLAKAHELALSQGHTPVIDVLNAFGNIDHNSLRFHAMTSAIHFWKIIHNRQGNAPRILHHDDQCGLLELAAYLNDETTVETLLAQHSHMRQHTQIRSAAYWAALHNNEEMFKKICKTDEDVVYTLWQLQTDQKTDTCQKFYSLANQSARYKFENLLADIVIKTKETISDRYEFAYEGVCKAEQSKFSSLIYRTEKFNSVLAYAYSQHNYVVVLQCLQQFKSAPPDIQNKLTYQIILSGLWFSQEDRTQNDFYLAMFWLIVNEIHPYQFLSNFSDKISKEGDTLKAFVNRFWTPEGLLNFSVSRQLMKPKPEEETIFIWQEKRSVNVFNAILQCLFVRYSEPAISKLLENPNEKDLAGRLRKVSFSDPMKNLFNHALRQFNVIIISKDKNCQLRNLPNSLWVETLGMMFARKKSIEADVENRVDVLIEGKPKNNFNRYLRRHIRDRNDPYFVLPQVSKSFYFFSKGLDLNNHKQMTKYRKIAKDEFDLHESEVAKLSHEILNLQRFVNQIRSEIDAKSCFNRRPCLTSLVIVKIFSGVIFGLNIWCAIKLSKKMSSTHALIDETIPPGQVNTCGMLSRVNNGTFDKNAPICKFVDELVMFCADLCETYQEEENNYVESIYTAIVGGIVFLSSMSFLIMESGSLIGKERFDSLPLAAFSKKINREAKESFQFTANADLLTGEIANILERADNRLQAKEPLLQVLEPVVNSKRKLLSLLPSRGFFTKPVVLETKSEENLQSILNIDSDLTESLLGDAERDSSSRKTTRCNDWCSVM